MLIHRGYKYRAYPNCRQGVKFAGTFGCCRFVYNRCLEQKKNVYASEKRNVSQYELMRAVTQWRSEEDTAWLADCDSMALQEAVKDLNKAFKNFFEKRAGYPKFRKKSSTQSYRTRNQSNGIRIVDKNHIHLPVIGTLKTKVSRMPKGRILNATITKTPSGKYFISLCVEEEVEPKPNSGCMTGIDVGLKEFYTDSNGNTVDNPRTLKEYEQKLRREQRSLARMIEANILKRDAKGRPVWKRPLSECKNIRKQRVKIARIHEKITDTRNDFLHKTANRLAEENAFIAVEDLNVTGMVKNHRLAKAISDVSWSRFFTLLDYKAFEHGCVVVKVPTFYPSSQTCSVCGHKNPEVKDLSVRSWVCSVCGSRHDRDGNAATNILNKGLEMHLAS